MRPTLFFLLLFPLFVSAQPGDLLPNTGAVFATDLATVLSNDEATHGGTWSMTTLPIAGTGTPTDPYRTHPVQLVAQGTVYPVVYQFLPDSTKPRSGIVFGTSENRSSRTVQTDSVYVWQARTVMGEPVNGGVQFGGTSPEFGAIKSITTLGRTFVIPPTQLVCDVARTDTMTFYLTTDGKAGLVANYWEGLADEAPATYESREAGVAPDLYNYYVITAGTCRYIYTQSVDGVVRALRVMEADTGDECAVYYATATKYERQ